MALTFNHKIYSPDIGDQAQARTQMATMASSVESALNTQAANIQQSLTQTAATLAELDSKVTARETIFATHEGDGSWSFADGLGEPVAVSYDGDDGYQIVS